MGGFQSGSMIGLLVAPLLMSKFGIAGPFYVFGTIDHVGSGVGCVRHELPASERKVGKVELKFIEDGGAIVDSSNSRGEK